MHPKKLTNKKEKFSPNKRDLWMACHAPPIKIAKQQGEMPLPSLSPIPSLNSTVLNGMGLRLDKGISPSFFGFLS